MNRLFRFSWLAALLLVGCTATAHKQPTVPLPQIDGPVTLRVVHAVNPRLPVMSPEQRKQLLEESVRISREHFGVEVRFDDRGEIPIADLFARLPAEELEKRRGMIYDFKGGGGDRERLVESLLETFEYQGGPVAARIDYSRPHLAVPMKDETARGLAEALTDTLLTRLARWRAVTLADGEPLLDAAPYNEWVLWDGLGYGELPWEVVISNQLMASAEYQDLDIHPALRGGITVGTTAYGRASRFGTTVMWTTFPFTEAHPLLVELRGGERYTPEEAAKLSGAYLAHEIGHQLFHLAHPFDRPACVMRPVEMLRFRQWYDALDAEACRVGSGPAMTPGAVKIRY